MPEYNADSASPKSISPPKKNLRAWTRTGGRCWYCGCQLDPDNFHMDHVVSRKLGGRSTPDNLVPACPTCNVGKGGRSVEEFRRTRTRQRDGIPYFNPDQLAWLADQGFAFPDADCYLFWFEEMGLE